MYTRLLSKCANTQSYEADTNNLHPINNVVFQDQFYSWPIEQASSWIAFLLARFRSQESLWEFEIVQIVAMPGIVWTIASLIAVTTPALAPVTS